MEKPEELEKVILDQYRQLANQQFSQAQMQQGIPSNWANALGGMGSGMAKQGQNQTQVSPIPYPQYQMPMGRQPDRMTIRFNRVNEVVEVYESQVVDHINLEPLDELRIKVAKWLYN